MSREELRRIGKHYGTLYKYTILCLLFSIIGFNRFSSYSDGVITIFLSKILAFSFVLNELSIYFMNQKRLNKLIIKS